MRQLPDGTGYRTGQTTIALRWLDWDAIRAKGELEAARGDLVAQPGTPSESVVVCGKVEVFVRAFKIRHILYEPFPGELRVSRRTHHYGFSPVPPTDEAARRWRTVVESWQDAAVANQDESVMRKQVFGVKRNGTVIEAHRAQHPKLREKRVQQEDSQVERDSLREVG